MFIDKRRKKNRLAPAERNVLFGTPMFRSYRSEEQDFSTVAAYKHLAPNGAKTTTSKNPERFVARTLESGH